MCICVILRQGGGRLRGYNIPQNREVKEIVVVFEEIKILVDSKVICRESTEEGDLGEGEGLLGRVRISVV